MFGTTATGGTGTTATAGFGTTATGGTGTTATAGFGTTATGGVGQGVDDVAADTVSAVMATIGVG